MQVIGSLPVSWLWRRIAAFGCTLASLTIVVQATIGDEASPQTHPLMPGLRSLQLHDTEWPCTLHDNLASGFSPLVCGMTKRPRVWAQVELEGRADWIYRLVLQH